MRPDGGVQLGLDADLELHPSQGAHAVANVPNTLDVFETHFPRFPVVPGVILVDSLARLAGRLLEAEGGRRWRLAGVEQARFRHYVRPGDQVALDVRLLERTSDAAVLEATASVAGKTVTQVRRLRMEAAG